jgi:hypothetical protein
MVKGSNQPLGLYCYDLDLEAAEAALKRLSAAEASDGEGCPGVRGPSLKPCGNSTALLPGVRHSLAVLPDAASAARSSVVSKPSIHHSMDDSSGTDEAEVGACCASHCTLPWRVHLRAVATQLLDFSEAMLLLH